MYLIDKPFVSDFLIETIRDNKYKIVATKSAKELIDDNSLEWVDENKAISELRLNPNTPIYSNSENSLRWVDENLENTNISKGIKVLKDKLKFRELTKNIFPNFYYRKVTLHDIQNLTSDSLSFPFVIKPTIGFFSIGVHIVENEEDWNNAKKELKPKNLESIFPKSVLDTTNFIIEEFIHGEEYAIDYYHNDKGEVVLLNVMHHLFSSGTDTSDRVYSTSKEIINKHKIEFEKFLYKIGKQLNLKNFPAHAEIRIDKNGKLIPIEINPLRFGGWCTTGDLLGITLGFNSYKCYFENAYPDWNTIFKDKENKTFSLIVLDNNSGVKSSDIINFDYKELSNDFKNPIMIRKIDISKYPVFGFVFTESDSNNKDELYYILNSNLRKYITIK